MYYRHEFVYALCITNNKNDTGIINGEMGDFHDCINNGDCTFYFYEALLLKFKYLLDNDMMISESSIHKYFNMLRGSIVSYQHLITIIPNLSSEVIEIDGYTYPVGLVSRHKECLTIYLNFLLERLYNSAVDIEDFIRKNFK